MKAVVCTRYGPPDVLRLEEVEKPAPKAEEVLIRIRAAGATASDGFIRSGFRTLPFVGRTMGRLVVGLTKPRKPILGLVLAGEIETAGRDVSRFRAGDRVYAFTKFRFGSYAEYTCLPEGALLALMPSNVTYEEAAAVPFGGLLALHFLGKSNIRSGQNVLIYGASGAVGTSAVQLARYFGAEVTGVCSTTNVEMVRFLGADEVIDYTKDDSVGRGERYDLILDAVGKSKSSKLKARCEKALSQNGKYVSVDDGSPKLRTEHLVLLKELIEAGQYKAVIDRCYPLEEIVEAHRYVDRRHKKGNVVITITQDSSIDETS